MIEEIKNIKSGKKELRKFGISVGAALALLGVLALFRGNGRHFYFFILSPVFMFLAIVAPRFLMPVHKIMAFLVIIASAIITNLVLCVLFYIVITPISLLGRLFGKSFLDLGFGAETESYWIPRKKGAVNIADYEKQF